MTDEPTTKPNPLPAIVDPDNIPTRVVNRIVHATFIGGVFDITLATSEIGAGPDGKPQEQARICARLRFDMQMAEFIGNEVQRVLAQVTPPPKDQQN